MNLFKSVLFLFLGLVSLNSVDAQKEIKEGYLKMKIVEATSDDEQMAAALQMIIGSLTEYYFNAEKAMVKADMMGGMVKIINVMDISNQNSTMYMDMMGQRMMVESTPDEREDTQKDQAEVMKEMEIVVDDNDTKEILGMKCVKASIKHPEMTSGVSFEMYISKDLQFTNKLIQGMEHFDLQGFPLEYSLVSEKMNLKVTAEEFKDKIDSSVFKISDAGYKKMTMAEFIETMGAFGGGGLGF